MTSINIVCNKYSKQNFPGIRIKFVLYVLFTFQRGHPTGHSSNLTPESKELFRQSSSGPQPFLSPGTDYVEDNVSMDRKRGWFQGESSALQMAKCLPAMWETRVQSPGCEDPLEKEMATHSSTLAGTIPWTKEPGRLESMGSHRVGHD